MSDENEVDEKKLWKKVKELPSGEKEKILESVYTLWVLLKNYNVSKML